MSDSDLGVDPSISTNLASGSNLNRNCLSISFFVSDWSSNYLLSSSYYN